METVYADTRLGFIRWSSDRPYRHWAMTVIGTMAGVALIKIEFSIRPFSKRFGKNNAYQLYAETGLVSFRKPSSNEIKKETVGDYHGWYIAPSEALRRILAENTTRKSA